MPFINVSQGSADGPVLVSSSSVAMLRPSQALQFSPRGYTRLWGLSDGVISGTASSDTGHYAVRWPDNTVEVYESGDAFSDAEFVDSSPNALTVTANGNARITAAQSKFGAASGYFDGSGDYLTVPYSPDFSPVGSALTIECWLRPDSVQAGSGNAGAIVSLRNASVLCGYEFSIRPDLTLQLLAYDGTFWALSIPTAFSTTALVADVWSHVALVIGSSGSTTLYINGVADSSFANVSVPYVAHPNDTTVHVGVGGDGSYRGYIDDLRIVRGTAVYTSNFTPPTAPLAAITGTSLLLHFDGQSNGQRAFELYPVTQSGTSLLLHLDGADGSTTFTDSSGNGLTVTIDGDAAISTAESQFGGASGYFGGSTWAAVVSPEMDVAQGDFTVEAWIFPTDGNGDGGSRTILHFNAGSFGGLHIHRSNGGSLIVDNGQVGTSPGDVSIPLGEWSHIAATRSGSTIRGFVNGVQCLSHESQGYINASQLQIGRYEIGGGATGFFFGYIDELRITKGAALYPTPFTPPTAPLTAITGTSLLLHCDGTNGSTAFTDSSGNEVAVTANGNAAISTAQSKFGGGSAAFSAGTDHLATGDSESFGFGTGDFTVEFWTWLNPQATVPKTANTFVSIGVYTSGVLFREAGGYGGTDALFIAGQAHVWNADRAHIPVGQWQHIALTRESGQIRVFAGGSLVYEATDSGDCGSSQSVMVGKGHHTAEGSIDADADALNGYIDDLRIVKGTAVYNANFTPPTAPLAIVPSGQPSGQFNGFDVSSNSLTQLRAEDVSINSVGDLSGNALSASALDEFYTDLDAGGGDIFVSGNPGIADDTPTIATAKGYTVFGSVPPSTALLLNFNGTNGSTTFTDSSPNALTVAANGNAEISTTQSNFGGASGYFDGDGDYLSVSAPHTAIGGIDGDFTIECWIYFQDTPAGDGGGAERQIVGQHSWPEGSGGNWWAWLAISSGLIFYASDSDGYLTASSNSFAWSSTQWYHVAITRSSGNVRMFVDGVLVSSATAVSKTLIADDSRSLTIGAAGNGLTPLNGYIDDLRIVKGAALYTANFTPPASQLGVYP